MTTMDTDSESQDSDDGRRFRFEATRKDATTLLEFKSRSIKKKSKHKSRNHRDRKERSKHESERKESRSSRDRDSTEKDVGHTTKQSRTVRHEDVKTVHKDHRETNDSKDRARDSKRYRTRDRDRDRDRDRGSHRKRSQERSRDRNHDDQASSEKHRTRCHDRSKYHSQNKSRDRSSNKLRSPDSDRSREEHGRHDSSRRTARNESKIDNLKNHHAHKVADEVRVDNGSRSAVLDEVVCTALPIDNQDCRDIDLSDYDVLSETDENLSDVSDARSSTPTLHCHKSRIKKHHTDTEYGGLSEKRITNHEQHSKERHKVNSRNSDPLSGSSNNNTSAVSDFLLGSTSSTTTATIEERKHRQPAECNTISCRKEQLDCTAKTIQQPNDCSLIEDTELLKSTDKKPDTLNSLEGPDDSAYGPTLPPQYVNDSSVESNSSDRYKRMTKDSHGDIKTVERRSLIGPCLPQVATRETLDVREITIASSDRDLEKICTSQDVHKALDDTNCVTDDVTFGPALPPHLMKKTSDTRPRNKTIGPTMPNVTDAINEDERANSSESESEDAIGPLPMEHPALRNSHIHEQLERRAKRIKDELREETDIASKREEWMMELPPAQSVCLGLTARKFRVTPAPDMSDRSCWTDTPAKKVQKQKEQEEMKHISSKEPNKTTVKESRKKESSKSRKREKSLLELHQSKLHKKKKAEEKEAKGTGGTTRRPFSRDIDLQTNRLDQSQKKSIFMKAQLLDDRFSRGEI